MELTIPKLVVCRIRSKRRRSCSDRVKLAIRCQVWKIGKDGLLRFSNWHFFRGKRTYTTTLSGIVDD